MMVMTVMIVRTVSSGKDKMGFVNFLSVIRELLTSQDRFIASSCAQCIVVNLSGHDKQ
jgi:hypothetical protein